MKRNPAIKFLSLERGGTSNVAFTRTDPTQRAWPGVRTLWTVEAS
jgi:hypothetical protein